MKKKVSFRADYKSRIDYAHGTDIPLTLSGRVIGSLPVSEFLA